MQWSVGMAPYSAGIGRQNTADRRYDRFAAAGRCNPPFRVPPRWSDPESRSTRQTRHQDAPVPGASPIDLSPTGPSDPGVRPAPDHISRRLAAFSIFSRASGPAAPEFTSRTCRVILQPRRAAYSRMARSCIARNTSYGASPPHACMRWQAETSDGIREVRASIRGTVNTRGPFRCRDARLNWKVDVAKCEFS